jgi:short-subunit dehydrogenase
MHGKTVVITGATSGIGEVAACTLAQQGARIVLIARDRARVTLFTTPIFPVSPR